MSMSSSLTLFHLPFQSLSLQRQTQIKLKPFLQFTPTPLSISSSSFSTSVAQVPLRSSNSIDVDDHHLSCAMPNTKPLRVAVLVSGGVDSSVALRLLHAAGHSCTAFYLKIWFQVCPFIHIYNNVGCDIYIYIYLKLFAKMEKDPSIKLELWYYTDVWFWCRKTLRTSGQNAHGKKI